MADDQKPAIDAFQQMDQVMMHLLQKNDPQSMFHASFLLKGFNCPSIIRAKALMVLATKGDGDSTTHAREAVFLLDMVIKDLDKKFTDTLYQTACDHLEGEERADLGARVSAHERLAYKLGVKQDPKKKPDAKPEQDMKEDTTPLTQYVKPTAVEAGDDDDTEGLKSTSRVIPRWVPGEPAKQSSVYNPKSRWDAIRFRDDF